MNQDAAVSQFGSIQILWLRHGKIGFPLESAICPGGEIDFHIHRQFLTVPLVLNGHSVIGCSLRILHGDFLFPAVHHRIPVVCLQGIGVFLLGNFLRCHLGMSGIGLGKQFPEAAQFPLGNRLKLSIRKAPQFHKPVFLKNPVDDRLGFLFPMIRKPHVIGKSRIPGRFPLIKFVIGKLCCGVQLPVRSFGLELKVHLEHTVLVKYPVVKQVAQAVGLLQIGGIVLICQIFPLFGQDGLTKQSVRGQGGFPGSQYYATAAQRNHQQERQYQSHGGIPPLVENPQQPVFQLFFPQRHSGGQRHLPGHFLPSQGNQGLSIRFPFFLAQSLHHLLVAASLATHCQFSAHPDCQGIEPVNRQNHSGKPFVENVLPAKMGQLMAKNPGQGLVLIDLCRQQKHRTYDAQKHWRMDGGAAEQGRLSSPGQGVQNLPLHFAGRCRTPFYFPAKAEI